MPDIHMYADHHACASFGMCAGKKSEKTMFHASEIAVKIFRVGVRVVNFYSGIESELCFVLR